MLSCSSSSGSTSARVRSRASASASAIAAFDCEVTSAGMRKTLAPHLRYRACESIGSPGLGVEPDLLQPGGETAKLASASAAICSSGIRWTRRPGVKRSMLAAGGVAGVAAAGDEEQVGLRSPAVVRGDPRVRHPVDVGAGSSCSRGGRRRAGRRCRRGGCGTGRSPSRRGGSPSRRRSARRAASPSRRSRSSTGRRGCRRARRSSRRRRLRSRSASPSRQSITWTKAVTGRPLVGPVDQALAGRVAAARCRGSGGSRPAPRASPRSKASIGMCRRTSSPTSVP